MKLALVACMLALSGCGKRTTAAQQQQQRSGSAAPASAKRPLPADFFGKKIAPPGKLAAVRFGASLAEARAAAPDLFPQGSDQIQITKDPTYDLAYAISLDQEGGHVSSLGLGVPASAKALMTSAWGAGTDVTGDDGSRRTYWFDPESGWRAMLEPGGSAITVDFHPYVPAAKLLGTGDALAFAPHGLLGATRADLRAQLGERFVDGAQPTIVEPATEWEDLATDVVLDLGNDGKVSGAWFYLSYRGNAGARPALRTMLEQKWGKGRPGIAAGNPVTIFRRAPPFVIVGDESYMHALKVTLAAKAPSP